MAEQDRTALRIPVGSLPAGGRGLRVRLHGVRHSPASFELQFYLNLPREQADTASMQSPHYAGSTTMYGLGEPGFADEALPETAPFDMAVDIDPGVVEKARRGGENELTMVLVSPDGSRLDPSLVRFEGLTVHPASE
jgi:hypothetical protein